MIVTSIFLSSHNIRYYIDNRYYRHMGNTKTYSHWFACRAGLADWHVLGRGYWILNDNDLGRSYHVAVF
jgi:hypothetical protein